MPPTEVIFGRSHTGNILSHTVYAKLNWTDDWEEKEHVVCENATWACAPSMGSAQLYYRYGPGSFPGVTPGDWLQRFTLPTLAYVRIDFQVYQMTDGQQVGETPTLTNRSWYGIVGTLVDAFLGADVSTTEDDGEGNQVTRYILQGKQTLNAVGLEWLLDRQYVMRSWWLSSPDETRRGLDFNLIGGQLAKNMSQIKVLGPDGVTMTHIFHLRGDEDNREYWTTYDIVEYLLAHHMGRNQVDSLNQPWRLNDAYSILPDWDKPVLQNVHGDRVWSLLNQLIPRQRGLSFYLEVFGDTVQSSADAKIRLVPFSLVAEDVVLPGDQPPRLKANPLQHEIDLTRDRTCRQLVVTKDAFSEYDQVHCIGARAVHVCSISSPQDFIGDWNLKDDYDQGASLDADYPAEGEIAARQRRDAEARSQKRLEDVYRRFTLQSDWNCTAYNGDPVFPDYDDPIGNPTDSARVIPILELPIWDRIPLYSVTDYTNRATMADSLPTDNPLPDWMEPQVFFKDPDGNWVSGDSIKISQEIEAEDEGRNYHFSVRVTPGTRPGQFYLDVSGQPQHVIAHGIFAKLDHDPEIGGVNYQDPDCRLTIGLLADYHCEARYPHPLTDAIGFDPNATLRVRVINAGDQYRLDYMVEGTAFRVEGRQLVLSTEDIILRDDREKLEQLAQVAFAWYGRTRKSIQFDTQFISDGLEIGDLITGLVVDRDGNEYGADPDNDVEPEEINTVVTSITISNGIGRDKPPAPQMSYKTEFSELDVISFFG